MHNRECEMSQRGFEARLLLLLVVSSGTAAGVTSSLPRVFTTVCKTTPYYLFIFVNKNLSFCLFLEMNLIYQRSLIYIFITLKSVHKKNK